MTAIHQGQVAAKIMGIVNVTPDSFSDGGLCYSPNAALERVEWLLENGSDFVDIGAESTRPGATPVAAADEWGRLEPLLTALDKKNLLPFISIDTRNESTIEKAIALPVSWINNVQGLAEEGTLQKIAKQKHINYICMHMQGEPHTMQQAPLVGNQSVSLVDDFFHQSLNTLTTCGLAEKAIYFDPGIGFGKSDAANLQLLAHTQQWSKKFKIMLGISRKSFLGRLLGLASPLERDPASKMLEFGLMLLGAAVIRTHEPAALVRMRNLLNEG